MLAKMESADRWRVMQVSLLMTGLDTMTAPLPFALVRMSHPLSSGKAVASSAVTRASGRLHTKGKTTKPSSAKRGPAEVTASCSCHGPVIP